MNFLKKHNFGIILLTLIIGLLAYTTYTIIQLYPEYTYAQEHSITLKTVLAATIVIGNVYFLITLPLFHWLGAKLNTLKGQYKKTDFLLILCKTTIFVLWVYISQDLYHSQEYNDDVDRMIIAGIFGATYVLFDLLYFTIILFTLFTRGFADSFAEKRNNKKNIETEKNEVTVNNDTIVNTIKE